MNIFVLIIIAVAIAKGEQPIIKEHCQRIDEETMSCMMYQTKKN